MQSILTYLFWPNPGNASYDSLKVVLLLAMSTLLICVSFVLRHWRRRQGNAVTRKLSASWSGSALWFGCIALVLVVSRVENIQFLAMRVLWVLWGGFAVLFLFVQVRQFRNRHYEILPRTSVSDPREKYLPSKKKR